MSVDNQTAIAVAQMNDNLERLIEKYDSSFTRLADSGEQIRQKLQGMIDNGAGILQVVKGSIGGEHFNTTSNSWVEVTGMNAKITPKSKDSTILVLVQYLSHTNPDSNEGLSVRIFKDGNPMEEIAGATTRGHSTSDHWITYQQTLMEYDKHNTQNEISYVLKARTTTGTVRGYINTKDHFEAQPTPRITLIEYS